MQKTGQGWFSSTKPNETVKAQPSLLADWNAYTAAQETEHDSNLMFDIEATVRTANDKVSGNVELSSVIKEEELYLCRYKSMLASKGVRDLTGSVNSATTSVPSGKSLVYFGLLLATGVFFIFIAFTMFLPVMVLMPRKFSICFTMGCASIIGSFFALKGPKTQLLHMASKERLPFIVGFLGTMVGTIYVSMVLHSYILSVFFSVLQVLALSYYAISYFPGGSAGLKFLSSTLLSSVFRCFGR